MARGSLPEAMARPLCPLQVQFSPCGVLPEHSRLQPFWPGSCQMGKMTPNQKAVLWDGHTCPDDTLGCPILSHLLLTARMWLLYRSLLTNHILEDLLKLVFYFDWNFLIISKPEIHDVSLPLFITPKDNDCWWMWFYHPDPFPSPLPFSTS